MPVQFPCLRDCLASLREKFYYRSVPLETSEVQVDGSVLRQARLVPQYLFRGENKDSRNHKTAVSSRQRIRYADTLDDRDRAQLGLITDALVWWFSDPHNNFDLRRHEAEGLVQHLGMPTDHIDFSHDLEVAAAFAVGERDLPSTGRGSICVLNVEQAQKVGVIAEFCSHRWCERARRQAAYGYNPVAFKDLRSAEADQVVSWFEFDIDGQDVELFRADYKALLDVRTDPVAGLCRFTINSYVADLGKLRPSAVDWIAKRIPMVPSVGRILSWHSGPNGQLPDVIDWVPPVTLPDWNEEQERYKSRCYWSENFPDHRLEQDYLQRSRMDELFIAAATYHPLASGA